MEYTSSVRRLESGTLAECGDGRDSSNGRPLQGPMRDSGLGSSMRRAVV
ncbi:unnamed protein product [Staurois parvus]|uniref:Uncharacterized protein n=1 Tax=Staurois parvus TaxID=386267 RepID=A0ABN9DXH1_9NEOB|nr:unnamed protein product [Staurois parvus]